MAYREKILDEFFTECGNVMRFLETEHGFLTPELREDNLWASLTYCKRDVGIECGCDLRDACISVYLVRLENGKIPEFHYKRRVGWINSKGELAKEFLSALIQKKRVNIPVIANGISQRQADFRSTLLTAKHTLIEHGKSVLDGSADVFINPPPRTMENIMSTWPKEQYEKYVAQFKSLKIHFELDKKMLAYAISKVREEADESWKKKDYKEVVRLYKLLAVYLTDEEKERLDYAKKQVADKSNKT
jgi:hypothetical protein